MIQIKKTILTLALLLTAVTGARADQLASSYSSNATLNAVTVSASMEVTIATGVTVTINNGLNITSGTLTVKGPGTLVVNGKAGSNGYYNNNGDGGPGGNGGVAISGNIIVQGGATVKATGGNGGNGGNSSADTGGNGAQGGAAITGEVTIQDASTLEATGGNGGNGGNGDDGGNGGNGGVAFAGTLTYKGGTVTADGGNGGSGGWGERGEEYGPSGSAGKAFTTSVNFVSSDYILTDGSNAITATQVTSKKKVVINPKVAVNSVTLGKTTAELTVGDYVALTATIDPTNATDPTVKWNVTAGAEKVKLYKDENCSTEVGTAATDVLTVYAKGLAVGEATVTVTSNDDATKTAACTVTVISSGPEVAWDKATKSGTFTMPGGNVTLEPEYYPQATVADGGVTAADADARATTDDPLVKVDATKLTGAKKLMYFVSNSGTTAPAYDAEGWTDQLPTAEGFTQQGIVYVWYYPVGIDEGVDGATATYSDGDICLQSITARIADAPTYAVEFAEGTEESDKWKADPATGVTKGETVTVTYTGSKKVIGVKAEKKAAEPVADIIWDGTNVTDLDVPGTESYTKEGVTLSANSHMMQAQWYNFGDPLVDGIGFNANEPGGFTFTAPTGKKFTKIEMTLTGSGDWEIAYGYGKLGTGWAFNADMVKEILTVTWTGSAASTVDLLKDTDDFSGANVKSIAFYLSK